MTTNEDPILSRREAAAYLGLSVQTMASMACRGGGPTYIRFSRTSKGGKVGYRRSALETWIAARTHVHTAEESWHSARAVNE